MKRMTTGAAAVAILVGLAAPASANGWYASGSFGLSLTEDHEFDTGAGTVETELDSGLVLSGAAGYDYGLISNNVGVRAEIELSYRDASVDSHSVGGTALPQPGGDLSSTALMVNALADFNPEGRITPYVGVGLGFAQVQYEGYSIQGVPEVLDDEDTVFAYQLIAGVGYALTQGIDLTAEYRFFATEDPEINATLGDVDTETEYRTQNVLVGARVNF